MTGQKKTYDEMTVAELMAHHQEADRLIVADLTDGVPGYRGIEGQLNFVRDRLLLTASILQFLGRKVAAMEAASKETKP